MPLSLCCPTRLLQKSADGAVLSAGFPTRGVGPEEVANKF